MKNIIFTSWPLLMLLNFAQAQNCKFKVNDVDKFNGKYTKITKSEKVINSYYTEGDFSVKKIDSSYYFIFDYLLMKYRNFKPYKIKKGAALIFLLENGDVVTLHSEDDIMGTKNVFVGIPPVYQCFLTNVSYPVTKNQIDKFFNSKVKSIRFYRTESNGKEDYVDNDIKNKNQDDIQDLIKCVL